MTPLAQALNTALIHFVWQGIAVGLLLWILLYVLRRGSANARYLVSCAALALLAVAPVVTAWAVYGSQTAGPMPWKTSADVVVIQGPQTWISVHPGTSGGLGGFEAWLLPAWAIGVALFALRLMWCWGHTSALRRTGTPADSSFLEMVSGVAHRIGVTRGVRVLMSSIAEVPSVIGWLRPVLLLPVAVAAGLTPQQLEAVIAHELAHIRRHDYFVNLLQTVVEMLLFYHPAVWWVSSKIRYERELCCDDLAVTAVGDVAGYARALAKLEQLRMLRPSLAMGAANGPLFHRIERLIGGDGRQTGPSRLACAVALGAGLVVALNAGWAQERQGGRGNGNTVDTFFFTVPPVPPLPPMPAMPGMPPMPPMPPMPTLPPQEAFARFFELERFMQDEFAAVAAARDTQWVLFLEGRVVSNASAGDQGDAQSARQSAGGGNLLWFKYDGKAYTTQDQMILNRVAQLTGNTRFEASQEAEAFLAAQQEKLRAELLEVQQRRTPERDPAAQAEVEKLMAQVRELASRNRGGVSTQDLEEMRNKLQVAEAQLRAAEAQIERIRVQSDILRREEANLAQLQAAMNLRRAEAARASAEYALRSRVQVFEVLREAIASGKAQPVR
jgi:beta-lactamase regulating signal transducer with metallopeptidase domain